jgi:hypothetical protein
MSTVAEILAAIKTLSPEEKDEIKLYLRELAAKEAQKAATAEQGGKIDVKAVRS